MEIIDAQVHPLSPAAAWREELSPEVRHAASAALTLAAMDAVGVRAALLFWTRSTTDALVSLHPDRFAGVPYMGWPDAEPERQAEYIDELADSGLAVGTRFVIASPPIAPNGPSVQVDSAKVGQVQDGAFDEYLSASQRRGMTVFVTAPGALPALHDMIRGHPDVSFVFDHLGLIAPVRTQKPWPQIFDDVPDVVALAKFPNVAIKFTAAPSLSSEPYPFADLWPRLGRIVDAFGVDRLLWGSDFTRCSEMHTYRESVDFILLSERFSASDKEMMMSGSLRRWTGWQLAP